MKNDNLKFKFILFLTFFLSGFLMWGNASAAEHYVRADVAGSDTGSDWINAWPTLPNTLVRGDVYYIADGSYTGYVFDDAADGTKVITVKKATVDEHGTSTGWNDVYGDGQAIFRYQEITAVPQKATFNIKASYITIDGVVGSGGDDMIGTYGFRTIYPADMGEADNDSTLRSGIAGIGVPTSETTNLTISNIKIYHVAIEGPGDIPCVGGDPYTCFCSGIGGNSANAENIEVANSYSYGWPQNISLQLWKNVSIHDNYFSTNSSNNPGAHGENLNLDSNENVLIYNNIVYNSKSFLIGIHEVLGGEASGVKIYNNLFFGTQGDLTGGVAVMDGSENSIYGMEVVGNTFVDIFFGGKGAVMVANLTDINNRSYAYNNLFYNCYNPRLDNNPTVYTANAIVHDNNAYLYCTGTINSADETSPQRDDNAATNPFVDSANGDYRLKIGTLPINNGKTDLGATYANDFLGNPRGASPDIGAYEYVGVSDIVAPAAPSGLAVI